MFTRVEVKNFKSLKHVDVSLDNFHVLVGPNGSGKTTFLDVFAFMANLLNFGIDQAVHLRANSFNELTFQNTNEPISFAFEATIPSSIELNENLKRFDSFRYQLMIYPKFDSSVWKTIESCILFQTNDRPSGNWAEKDAIQLAEINIESDWTIIPARIKTFEILSKQDDQTTFLCDTLACELSANNFATDGLALSSVSEDLKRYPITTWLKRHLRFLVQPINLDSNAINKAGKEGRPRTVTPDGSNLPWLIESLKTTYPDRYKLWMRHVKATLPNIVSITTKIRKDYNDKYLKIKYKEGHEVKQWMVSDGTLRLLLLTIIPYNLQLEGLFLIEEPEIGINPQAIQAVMDSLRSVYEGQVLVTTHSPEAVNAVRKKDLLIFTKSASGETQITSGLEHSLLKNWKGDIGSGVFYGAGIMG